MNSDHRGGYVTMVNPGRAPCGYATQYEPRQNAVGYFTPFRNGHFRERSQILGRAFPRIIDQGRGFAAPA